MTYQQKPWGDAYTIRGTVTNWDKRYKYLRLGVTRPGLYAATLLQEACERAGITIGGGVRAGTAPASARTLHRIRTKPLVEAIRLLNQESNNVVAELVTRNLGAEKTIRARLARQRTRRSQKLPGPGSRPRR